MPNIIGPNGFILLRVAGAVTLFWIIFGFKFEKVARIDLLRLAFCGLFGVAINQLLFFNGLMLTSPLNAPVIMTMTPVLVLVLSFFILKEKITFLKGVGVIIGAAGSVIFIMQNTSTGFATEKGDLFILMSAASYALYLVLVKPLMAKYKPLTVITWVFTFGLVYVSILGFSFQEVSAVNWAEISGSNILRILFVVIGVTFLPYLLTVFAMKNVSPSIAAVYIYLQPILSAFFVYIFYLFQLEDYTGDFSIEKLMSALLVFMGVYLVIKKPRTKTSS